jgi:HD-GYP domain-containing protein (c-di-GMP phosphodiesterase class II)
MLRIDVRKATPGMQLALPVNNPRVRNQVLLKANFSLDESAIKRLEQLGISSIWVSYPSLNFLEKFVNRDVLQAQGNVVNQITDTFEKIQKQATARLPYEQYTQSIGELISQLLANPQAALFMGDLTSGDTPDTALMRHSSTVTYLSLLMGLKLEGYLIRQRKHVDPGQAKEVNNLGLGAMMHDIGITQLDPAVRQKFKQTGVEDAAWKEHPSLGYQLVKGKVAATAATVVLNHHQRFDGSGYAGKDSPILDGTRLHIFARIVGLADYYDEYRNPPNGPALPPVAVLRHLLEEATLKKFDPQVMRALLTVVPPYPPGSIVQLSDQRWAAVIDHNPQDPCKPKVQIIPSPNGQGSTEPPGETIDLSADSCTLTISMFEDHDVSAMNFPAPALMAESLAQAWM